jgi:hypothetical protein
MDYRTRITIKEGDDVVYDKKMSTDRLEDLPGIVEATMRDMAANTLLSESFVASINERYEAMRTQLQQSVDVSDELRRLYDDILNHQYGRR